MCISGTSMEEQKLRYVHANFKRQIFKHTNTQKCITFASYLMRAAAKLASRSNWGDGLMCCGQAYCSG